MDKHDPLARSRIRILRGETVDSSPWHQTTTGRNALL
jgi:hypothetical protein